MTTRSTTHITYTRKEATRALVDTTEALIQAHFVIPTLLEAKANSHREAFNDAIVDGQSVTAAKEYATQAAAVHTSNYERARSEIAALSERAALLRFLLEHDLTD